MANRTNGYADAIPACRSLRAKHADVGGREVRPLESDAFGVEPMTA